MNTPISRTCFQCGSELVLVSTVTEKLEGSLFPQTTSIYRCSNQSCQEEKDKETEKRKSQQKERAVAEQRRADERQQKRSVQIQEKLKH